MNDTEHQINEILQKEFKPKFLEVINQSHLHAGHSGARPGRATHFKVTVVSDRFESVTPLNQHKLVYQALKSQLENGVHALVLKTVKSSQWEM